MNETEATECIHQISSLLREKGLDDFQILEFLKSWTLAGIGSLIINNYEPHLRKKKVVEYFSKLQKDLLKALENNKSFK